MAEVPIHAFHTLHSVYIQTIEANNPTTEITTATTPSFEWNACMHHCSSHCNFARNGDALVCLTTGNCHFCTEMTCNRMVTTVAHRVCEITGTVYPLDLVMCDFDARCRTTDDNEREVEQPKTHADDHEEENEQLPKPTPGPAPHTTRDRENRLHVYLKTMSILLNQNADTDKSKMAYIQRLADCTECMWIVMHNGDFTAEQERKLGVKYHPQYHILAILYDMACTGHTIGTDRIIPHSSWIAGVLIPAFALCKHKAFRPALRTNLLTSSVKILHNVLSRIWQNPSTHTQLKECFAAWTSSH